MKKLLLGTLLGLSAATFSIAPANAADLPTFTASDTTVAAGDVVTITVTPGTGDSLSPSGADNLGDICAGYWAGDNPSLSDPHFSLAGEFNIVSGSYARKNYPSDPNADADGNHHSQWSSAGWGDFAPLTQSSPITFDFTIPSDINATGEYRLSFSCMSPQFWLRDRLTLVQYTIDFTVSPASAGGSGSNGSNSLANTGSSGPASALAGMVLVFTGIIFSKMVLRRKTK